MNQLIGVAGKAGAGKDTFVLGLIQAGYIRAAFADALKHVTAMTAGEPVTNFTDLKLKEEFSEALQMTRRRALQNVGNMMRQATHDGIWLQRVVRDWEASGRVATAISDVRYPNEAAAVKDAGGIVVRIERPSLVGLTGEAAVHASEVPLADHLVDITIQNDGTVEELYWHASRVARFVSTGAWQ